MIDIIDDLEECGLRAPAPHRFFRTSLTSGESNRKKPYALRRKWMGVWLVVAEKFEGRCTVKVTDESAGYSRLLASATGLHQVEAERMFDIVVERLRAVV